MVIMWPDYVIKLLACCMKWKKLISKTVWFTIFVSPKNPVWKTSENLQDNEIIGRKILLGYFYAVLLYTYRSSLA